MNFFRKEEGMRNTKKIVKSFVSLMLALVLALSFAPVSASAASATSKLRTNGTPNKSYSISTVLPGKVSVSAKVKVESAASVPNYNGSGYTVSVVKMHVAFPKSQINKVKKNVSRIINASPVISTTRSGNYVKKTVKPHYSVYPVAVNRSTGKLLDGKRLACKASIANDNVYTYKQGNYSMQFVPSFDITFATASLDNDTGNILVGISGVKAPTFSGDKKIAKFASGKTSITKTNFYNKKNKKLSIWVTL